jgi:hypothetical protein
MNPNRTKQRSDRKKIGGKEAGSDYRLLIVLSGAILLALMVIGALILTSR